MRPRGGLTFVARRLGAEGVVLLLTTRRGASPHVESAGLTELGLGGLDLAATRALLDAVDVAPAATSRPRSSTWPRPRALREPAVAAAASERAARLTPDVEERVRRLRQAAEDRLKSGNAEPALLTEALELAPGLVLRADLQLLLGLAEEHAGRPREAADRLVAEAARVAPHDAAAQRP